MNPASPIRVCSGDGRKSANREEVRVASGGVGRIWKGLLPQLDMGFLGVEFYASEKVFSRSWKPWFRGGATRFERRWFVVKMVDRSGGNPPALYDRRET